MAYGDYIHCCKCDVKLIYDGDRSQREWWVDRFDKEPEIECPDCKADYAALQRNNEALRQLTSDLLSALEYHEEQTRPIHSTTIAIEAARAALARAGEVT